MPYPSSVAVAWTKVSGPGGPGAIPFSNPSQTGTLATMPLPTSPAAIDVYTLQLAATDDGGTTNVQDTMTLTVRYAQNRAPTVNPGTYTPITFATSLPLVGSATDEGLPVGGAWTWAWTKVSGPGTVGFTNASAASTSATFSMPGEYVLRLCATDGAAGVGGLTGCAETAVSVKGHALLVVGIALNATGDTAIKTRLENLGYTVTVKTSSGATTGNANNKNVVIIAGTAVDSSVNNKFRNVVQPVVVLKHSLLDNMSMTGTTSGTHFGTATSQTQVAIVAPTDRLAAGLSGTRTVTTTAATFTWGLPPASPAAPIAVATLAADATKATILRYPSGAMMSAGLAAPGNRVAFFAQDVAANAFTTEGGWLFDAAVGWAANTNVLPRADAGPDRSVVLALPGGSDVLLDGRCIDDGLPATCTFQWANVGEGALGPCPATVGSLTAEDLSLHFDSTAHCRFRLTVYDGLTSAFDEVEVYVSNPNAAPIVSVTAPSSLLLSSSANLVASVVDDGLPIPPGAVSVTWGKVSGPGIVTFTPTGQFTATASFSVKGTYVIQASASDGALSGSATASISVRQPALLVTSTAGNDLAETLLSTRLAALGYEVTALSGAASTSASATGMAVVVISPAAVPVDVGTDFNTVLVPVVTINEALFDENRLATAANHGSLPTQTKISITSPTHALAAGLSGAPVVAQPSSFGWAVPAPAAVKVASLATDPAKWTVFGYEQGAAMTSGTAQRRRVGFFAGANAVTKLTANGLALLDAAVSWAAAGNLAPRITLPTPLAVPVNTALSLPGSVIDDGLPSGSSTCGPASSVTCQWTKQSGTGTAVFADASAAATSVTLSDPVDYVLRLTASDGQLSSFREVTVTVSSGNQAPFVSAGPDLVGANGSVTLATSGQLQGSVVDDGLPAPPAFTIGWSKLAGPGTAKFASPASPTTTVTFDAGGRYVLRLTASDGVETSYDDVIVDVNASAVLVTAAAAPDAAETSIKTRLEQLGFSVALVAAASSSDATADNMSLVFLSPSAADADVTTKFRSVAAPVITTKATLLDEMALVGASSQGSVNNQTNIAITTPAHPMAAGLSGTVTVLSPAATLGWGNPNANATKVATQVGQANRSPLFAYDTGAGLPVSGLSAPARRATFLFCIPSSLNANGWLHFDATVRWVTSINAPPKVVVGADQVITLPVTATVTGTVFDDGQPSPPGAVTRSWTVEAGPAGVILDTPTALSTVAHFPEQGTYVLKLSASDGVLTGSDQLTMTVRPNTTPPNEAPYVSAGVDQIIRLPNTAVLSGLASDDGLPLPSTLTVAWSRVAGLGPAGTVVFGTPTSLQTTATFPSAGTYVLRLTASDGQKQSTDDVRIVVQATKTALLVVPNSASLTASETAIRNRLIALAFTVTVADDGASNLKALGENRDLVFVCHADPLALGAKLVDAEVPVIVSKATLYPNMAMADSDVPGVDFGEVLAQTQITITNSALPFAAGLSGTLNFTTAPTTFGFAAALLDDWKAAEIPPISQDQGTLFGYEEGTTMLAALRAPARRIGFPSAEATLYTPEAWLLFDAAVKWAIQPVVPALYVSGSCGSGYDEKETRRHMALEGYAVTMRTDASVTTGDANGKALVVVSRSVCAATLGTKLRDVAVPVITFDPENFAVMQMTGTVLGDDYGTTPDQTRLQLLDPAHPLAGGQTGVVEVLSESNGDFGWAVPASSASRVAVTVGFSYGTTVFAYEKGASMVGLVAPARRIGLYMNENSVQRFVEGGWAILDAALRWSGAADPDGDSLSTFDEFKAGTDPTNPDTNGDGISDAAQVLTDRGATNTDMDADGVSNALELQKGTDPFNPDTDGDGTLDGTDCFPLDPTRFQCPASTPGDITPPIIQLTEPTNAVLISSVP